MSHSTIKLLLQMTRKAPSIPFARSLLVVALFVPIFLSLARADTMAQSQWVFPLSSRDLLALLPAAPENWKLTTSTAGERLSVTRAPETFAVREYLHLPPPSPNGAVSAVTPDETVRMTLIDTGNDPTRFALFTGFKPGKPSSPSTAGTGYLNLLVEGLPAIQYAKDPDVSLTVAVSERFLLFIRLTNIDDSDRDRWLELARLSKLAEASANAPKTPLASGIIAVEAIDELHPVGNYKSQLDFTTQADQVRIDQATPR